MLLNRRAVGAGPGARASTRRCATRSTRRRARSCSCRCRPTLKYQAKPFIDVTVDRFAKGLGALIILVLIKRRGASRFSWQQLSYASLTMIGAVGASRRSRAREVHARSFRSSIEQQDVRPADLRLERRRSRRRSRRSSASWRTRTRAACSTRSTCWSRSTSGTSSRRCCCARFARGARASAWRRWSAHRPELQPSAGCRASNGR